MLCIFPLHRNAAPACSLNRSTRRTPRNEHTGHARRRRCRVGLDAAAYSGHSLRSGFLTSAAESGGERVERLVPADLRHVLIASVADGELSGDEAASIATLLEAARRAYEVVELEKRIAVLEQRPS
jgi:hypothetical protein